MEKPVRKALRLPCYDYSQAGAYFVTICTHDRCCVLSSIHEGRGDPCGRPLLELTAIDRVAEKAFQRVEQLYGISIDKYVIMPNHVHFICRIEDARATTRVAPTLGRIVGAYKSIVANESRKAGFMEKLWQRNYHEHVIRDEHDFREIWTYLEGNPSKWIEDKYFAPYCPD